MTDNNRIRWVDRGARGELCPLCGSADSSHMLDVSDEVGRFHSVHRCRSCETLFYPDVLKNDSLEYYDEDLEHPNWRKYYVEIGAGIEFIIEVINRVPLDRYQSFIDVGCGTGFSVDYVQNYLGKSAVGAEPSIFGRDGEAGFGVTIFDKPLQELSPREGAKCDFIFSSEVIEHVRDTDLFLQTVSSYLSDDGILALTTPNARFIDKKNQQSRVCAALFPGEHKIIFSSKALYSCLRKAGFEYIELGFSGSQTLVAYASKSPFELDKFEKQGRYLQYLKKRLDVLPLGESMAKAYRGRLFIQAMEENAVDEAKRLAPEVYRDAGIDTHKIPSELKVLSGITKFRQYGDHFSFANGAILYSLSCYESAITGDKAVAYQLSRLAVEAITKESRLGPTHLPLADSLLARAMVLNAQLHAHLNGGDWKAALIDGVYAQRKVISFAAIKKVFKSLSKESKGPLLAVVRNKRKMFLAGILVRKALGANN